MKPISEIRALFNVIKTETRRWFNTGARIDEVGQDILDHIEYLEQQGGDSLWELNEGDILQPKDGKTFTIKKAYEVDVETGSTDKYLNEQGNFTKPINTHSELEGKNAEADFQHATQEQHDRWTNNYSYKIENKEVSTWAASTAYAGYGYQAQINIADLSEFDSVNVVFGLLDAISGNYAPAIEIYEGYIWVFSKVNTTITIPTIEITKIDL